MFELFSDIYFVVYKLYYVGQNDNLDIRVSLKNWDRGSSYVTPTMSSLRTTPPHFITIETKLHVINNY
jgi:hypothetical protein